MTANNFFPALGIANANIILAHGAGAGSDSEFMQQVADKLSQLQINVYLFDFPYMKIIKETGKRRPPGKFDTLITAFEQQITCVSDHSDLPLFIGGKSMGGRVASHILLNSQKVLAGVALGYPFHPPGKLDKLRIDHLSQMQKPLLILQGERDTFGDRTQVANYNLPKQVQLDWCKSGDHSLKPLKSSGISHQDNLDYAVKSIEQFIQQYG